MLFHWAIQFSSKAQRAISLQANGVLSLWEVCGRWGQPQVETSELCSSVIDLSPGQLAQAADLSWEWKAANSLRLREQNWPARQRLRAWCHRCRVSLGGREAASAPVGSSGFDLAQVRQTVPPLPLMPSWQYRGEKEGASLFGRRPGWGGGRPGLFDSRQASWCWGLNIKTEKRKLNLSLPLALCYINEILISLATYTTLKLTNQRFFLTLHLIYWEYITTHRQALFSLV